MSTASALFPNLPSSWVEKTATHDATFYRLWHKPGSQTGKALFLVHGFGEHSERYTHFPFYLDNEVDVIFAIDLPGHGLSQGPRGHADRFDDFVNITEKMLGFSQTLFPKLNWYLLGHSMGGLVVTRLAICNSQLHLKKIITSALYLDLAKPVSVIKQFFGLLIEPVLPRLAIKSPIDLHVLTHDPSVIESYNKDPLTHNMITPRLYKETLRTQEQIKLFKGPLNYSIDFLIPLADPLVSWKSSYAFANQLQVAQGKHKTVQTFPNFFHEGFNESEKFLFFNSLSDCLKY